MVVHRVGRLEVDGVTFAACSCGERVRVETAGEVEAAGLAHVHERRGRPRAGVAHGVDVGPVPVERVPAIGVAGEGRLWLVDGERGRPVCRLEGLSAGALAAAAMAVGLREILVDGGALEGFGLPAELPAGLFGTPSARREPAVDERPAWLVGGPGEEIVWRAAWRARVRPRAAGPWCSLVLLPYDAEEAAGPWGSAASCRALCEALSAFHGALGAPWADGVGRTVERLILSTHPRDRGGVALGREPFVPEPALDSSRSLPEKLWRRRLTAAEARAGWVHCFDANAFYLSAWGSAELGFGAPVHVVSPAFDRRTPGLWRVEGGLPAARRGDLLPAPWAPADEWYTTPTIVRAGELLAEAPAIAEAWIWPEHSRFLRAAGTRIRDARAALLGGGEAAGLAKLAVGALYQRGTGRLQMAERDERSGWRRPDWAMTVYALSRVNLDRRLRKLEGAAPFAIATDGLAFAADEGDPRAFAEKIGLPVGTGLGEFSIEESVRLTPALRRAVDGASYAGAVMKAIRAAVGEGD